MDGYTKLAGTIVTSTIWRESAPTKVVWITMLALANKHGEVMASVPGLAAMAKVSPKQCQKALDRFLAPDPDSRTQDYEGRRIEPIHGGWRLLNYEAYRQMLSLEDRREKAAERQKRYRDNSKINSNATVTLSDASNATITQNHEYAESREQRAESKEQESKKEKARDVFTRIQELGFRDSRSVVAQTEYVNRITDYGTEPELILERLSRIYRWTQNGKYAPRLSEVIRRCDEPQELWEREHGTDKQNSKAELRSDASHAAIQAALKRRLAANGHSDAEPS